MESTMDQERRVKGRVLEDLVWSAIQDMGLPFDPTFKNGYTNKKGEKYPDFISDLYNIEVKYWSCRKLGYTIDEFRYYSQIDNRFDPNKGKILIISDPRWSSYASGLAAWNGVCIISLGLDDLEFNYVKAYWTIRNKLTEFFISEGVYLNNLMSTAGEIVIAPLRKVLLRTAIEFDLLIQAYYPYT